MSIKGICKNCQSPVTSDKTSFCSESCKASYDKAQAEKLQQKNIDEIKTNNKKMSTPNNDTGSELVYKTLYNELKKQHEDLRVYYTDIKNERDRLKVEIETVERRHDIEKQKFEDDYKLKIREKELELKENAGGGLAGFSETAKDLIGKIMPGGIKDLLEGMAALKTGQINQPSATNQHETPLSGFNTENQIELQNILNVLQQIPEPEKVLEQYKKAIMIYAQSPEQFKKIQNTINKIFEEVKSTLIN